MNIQKMGMQSSWYNNQSFDDENINHMLETTDIASPHSGDPPRNSHYPKVTGI